jgi:hypothetical protein
VFTPTVLLEYKTALQPDGHAAHATRPRPGRRSVEDPDSVTGTGSTSEAVIRLTLSELFIGGANAPSGRIDDGAAPGEGRQDLGDVPCIVDATVMTTNEIEA